MCNRADDLLRCVAGDPLQVFERFGFQPVQQNAREARGRCPIHGGDNPSAFVLALSGEKVGQWYCHTGCHKGGDFIEFLGLRQHGERWNPRSAQQFAEVLTYAEQSLGIGATPAPEQGHLNPRPTLEGLAAAKELPVRYLSRIGLQQTGNAVHVPYRLEDGTPAPRQRLRTGIIAANNGSKWTSGPGEIVPYGLERLDLARNAGYLILAEGESDCWTCWFHGEPALGIPGKNLTKCLKSEHLAGVGKVFVVEDQDGGGGAEFVNGVRNRMRAIGWAGIAQVIRAPVGCKDLNDLHRKSADDFRTILHQLMEAAPLVELPDGAPAKTEERTVGNAVVRRLSEVQPEGVRWLWFGRIPLAKLTVMDGDPGLGKSLVTIDLSARVSTGRPMPDGSASDLDCPRDVLLLSAEDGLADTIRPRLDAAGADCRRVHALEAVLEPVATDDGITLVERQVTLANVATLEEEIRRVNAVLVVVDPIMAFLPAGCDAHRDQDVRTVLRALTGVADRTGAAILLVRHLNKTNSNNALYRGGGSIGIVGAARAGLLIARDPADETGETRVLAITKGNLSAPAPALQYRITATDTGAVVSWDGFTTHSADSLLRDTSVNDLPVKEAAAFLREALADGPLPAKEVQALAAEAKITSRTLERAKKQAGVKSEKSSMSGVWVWRLLSGGSVEDCHSKPKNATPMSVASFDRVGTLQATEQPTSLAQPAVEQSNHEPGSEVVHKLNQQAEISRENTTQHFLAGLFDEVHEVPPAFL